MSNPTREMFPVMGGKEYPPSELPFAALVRFNHQAIKNHGQSLEQLARRGGCSWEELQAIVEGWSLHECGMGRKPWPNKEDAERIVRDATTPAAAPERDGGEL